MLALTAQIRSERTRCVMYQTARPDGWSGGRAPPGRGRNEEQEQGQEQEQDDTEHIIDLLLQMLFPLPSRK
jgi:hypothetical protein